MKLLFILGRNPELSIAELKSVLGNFEFEQNKNAILAEIKNSENIPEIKKFGGIINIGEILASGNIQQIIKELNDQEIYLGTKNNFNYVLWNFSSENKEKISDYLKKRFKKEKLKATEKIIGGEIETQNGKKVPSLSSGKLIDEQYFLFASELKSEKFYFGKITQNCNYEEIEKRDMKKPIRRESLSISPRLAKIMINLSKGDSIIDAFCGIGVILQEALLQEKKVFGIDKDYNAIQGAKQNLAWNKFPRESYKLFTGDSSKVPASKMDSLVSEPDFGKILIKIPTKEKADEMIKNYEELMIKVLVNMKQYVQKRFVFTAPLIKTVKGQIGADFEKISKETNLKLSEGFPIPEFRKGQIVGREIVVMERNK